MADWWDQFAPAPSQRPQGGSPFLTPQTGGGSMFAGLPAEALLIAGLSGPEGGMKFLSPFMTQAPVEVMGPDGKPQLMSPWQARGFATPTSTLGFMREGREAQGQQFNQGLDTQKFNLERDKHLFDKDIRTRHQAVTEAVSPVLPGPTVGAPPQINPAPGQAAAIGAAEKEAIDAAYKSAAVARTAATGIQSLHEARRLVDQGMIAGFGADFRVGFGKALQAAGINLKDKPEDNSQAFVGAMANQVFATIKNLGSGSGISDADREFARAAAGGSIQLSEGAIRTLLDIGERASRRAIEMHRDVVSPYLGASGLTEGARRALDVQMPPQYAPLPAGPTAGQRVAPGPATGGIPGGPMPQRTWVPGRGIQ